ncbi:MAG: glycosyltransferase [Clostridia bacterium]|nr:glycosyltransferase [Clostridia bacterium]
MKNIGLLISELNSGGAERVVSRVSKILEDKYNIYVILFEDTYMEYDHGGTLVNLDAPAKSGALSKVLLLLERIRKLRKKKKELKLDCVISFLDSPNMVNILSKVKGCKSAVSIRNYSASENRGSLLGKITNALYKMLYKRADKVVPVTKVIEDLYIKNYNIPKEKLKVIYNPYDIAEIEEQMKKECDYNLSKTEGKITFITVGRQMYQKGYWHLIKAFRKLHGENENTALIMVGQIDEKVVNLIQKFNLEDSIVLTDRHPNPFSFIAKSDIYVLSSLFEGFPNSMTEAMVCSLPIIAADCKSGPREILAPDTPIDTVSNGVEEAQFGIITTPLENEEEWESEALTEAEEHLYTAMKRMTEDKELREKYARLAKMRSESFGYGICKENFIDLIENI